LADLTADANHLCFRLGLSFTPASFAEGDPVEETFGRAEISSTQDDLEVANKRLTQKDFISPPME